MGRLDKFSAVLVLENWNASYTILRHVFGWDKTNEPQGSSTKKHYQSVDLNQIQDVISPMITFDQELYAYASYLNTKQVKQADNSRYLYAQKSKVCKNPCCGNCSSG